MPHAIGAVNDQHAGALGAVWRESVGALGGQEPQRGSEGRSPGSLLHVPLPCPHCSLPAHAPPAVCAACSVMFMTLEQLRALLGAAPAKH